MSFAASHPLPRLRLGRHIRPWVVLVVLAVLVVLIVLATVGTSVLVDLLFYRDVHATGVFTTVLVTRLALFAIAGVVGAAVVGANLVLGYTTRPAYVPMSADQQQLEAYRVAIAPVRRYLAAAVIALVGLIFGIAGQHDWQTVQLWLHATSFGQRDPQFHRDLGWYAFDLPFERMLLSFGFAMLIVGFIAALLTQLFFGGIHLQARGAKVSAAARAHLSVIVGLFLVLKALAYYLDRYGLTLSAASNGTTGADYADVHAALPAKTILIFIAAICAALFIANAVRRGTVLALAGLGTMVFAAVVVGGLVPFLVQQFHVKPNAIALESPYLGRSITATRQAYQIEPQSTTAGGQSTGAVVTSTYDAPSQPAASAVATSTPNVANARLLDPNLLQQTFEQLQQIRSYYSFPSSLDVDRYRTGGQEQTYVVATRDVDLTALPSSQRNWVNEHLVYTHGQGFVAAQTGAVDPNGRPVFADEGIPATDSTGGAPAIPVDQPQIYYGELSPSYSVVDTAQAEVDGTTAADYHYEGGGGVRVGSRLGTRLALALHFRDYNLLFSSSVTSSSKILYFRDPRTRVAKVAPWLTLDGDPYPAVVDGRIVWIVDGYTTSDDIPYSQRVSLGGTTTTASTGSEVAAQSGRQIDYIRNSVKATVDAYTGKVTLYAFENGTPDPVLRTWEKVFPGTVQPESAIPAALRAHLRYPEDLFTVQRQLLARYHVSDPKTFFQGTDFWQVANDPVDSTAAQAPYYEELQLPGQSAPEFQLATSLTYNQRPNLAAFVAVSSDPSDYGTIRVLQLPQDTVLQGPANVYTSVKSDTAFARDYSLLNANGSQVLSGNLLTLPVGGGLLFVQPFYTQATNSDQGLGAGGTSSDSFPLLRLVVVVYGDKVGYAPTLAGAISAALSGGGGTTTGSTATGGTTPAPTPSPTATTTASAPVTATVAVLQAKVSADFAAAQAALSAGNLGGYQSEIAQAEKDYAALLAASGSGTTSAPAPTTARSSAASPAAASPAAASPAAASPAAPAGASSSASP